MDKSHWSWLRVVPMTVGLASGILSIIREFLQFTNAKFFKEEVLFWASIRVAFIVSVIWAWWLEHSRHQQAIKEKEEAERKLNSLYPKIDVKINEVHLLTPSDNGVRVFISATLHNTEPTDTALPIFKVALTIDGKEYESDEIEDLNDWRFIRKPRPGMVYLPSMAPMEEMADLRIFSHSLRRGFPVDGWIAFYVRHMHWPITSEQVDESSYVGKWDTSGVQRITLTVIDPFSRRHSGSMLPPWKQTGEIKLNIPVPEPSTTALFAEVKQHRFSSKMSELTLAEKNALHYLVTTGATGMNAGFEAAAAYGPVTDDPRRSIRHKTDFIRLSTHGEEINPEFKQMLEEWAGKYAPMFLRRISSEKGKTTVYEVCVRAPSEGLINFKLSVEEPKPEWMNGIYSPSFPFRVREDTCDINPNDTEHFPLLEWWINADRLIVSLGGFKVEAEGVTEPWNLNIKASWQNGSNEGTVQIIRQETTLYAVIL